MIDQESVLTAAHCFDESDSPDDYTVILGKFNNYPERGVGGGALCRQCTSKRAHNEILGNYSLQLIRPNNGLGTRRMSPQITPLILVS